MKKNNAKRTVVVIALIALMAIPSMFAYFTGFDSADNVFTVGNVKIDLQEEAWNPENGKLVAQDQVIPKDPKVKNTGSNEAYVFLAVTAPENFKYDNATIAGNMPDGWTATDLKVDADANAVVYVYGDGATMTKLASEATTPVLFNSIKYVGGEGSGAEEHVMVRAYAVQTTDIEATDMTTAWNAVKAVTSDL